MPEPDPRRAVEAVLRPLGAAAVAVSGGVDSLTLATLAHAVLGDRVTMHHAVSPAVPAEATNLVEALARAQGWRLDVFDAGEFADPRYRANPADRCFFCKINLYGAIARRISAQILSGTNLDDLGEYRPGLSAAREHQVRHPFVEAGLAKPAIRSLAARLGLGAIAELPAAPCLASRVETGLRIEAPALALIDRAETLLRAALAPRTVRCRIRASGIVIELDADTLGRLDLPAQQALARRLAAELPLPQPVAFAAYRNGSACLRPQS